MAWSKITVKKENGTEVVAQAPVIISASRSTDIPAFYAEWFFHRLKLGYSAWKNPFNGVTSYVSYAKTRFIVFWSKNPEPLLNYIDQLEKYKINCYIQFTLNDYEFEGLEKGVPSLSKRIQTFKDLVAKLGKGHVVWRFDPLILTDKISIQDLLHKIEFIGDSLFGYTEKLVFSFADIASYKKVKNNLEKNNINYQEWDELMMNEFAYHLAELNKKWNYELATCGEKIDIEKYGILHNHCVDDTLMIRIAYKDKELMNFLGVELKTKSNSLFESEVIPTFAIDLDNFHYAIKKRDNKDKGQRAFCGCMVSKDVGEYNTCPHLCEYCYANSSKAIAVRNNNQHKLNNKSETITGI